MNDRRGGSSGLAQTGNKVGESSVYNRPWKRLKAELSLGRSMLRARIPEERTEERNGRRSCSVFMGSGTMEVLGSIVHHIQVQRSNLVHWSMSNARDTGLDIR